MQLAVKELVGASFSQQKMETNRAELWQQLHRRGSRLFDHGLFY